MRKKLLCLLLILIAYLPLLSYDTGKSPGKAAFYSFLLPGAGQYYNESYSKAFFWATSEIAFISITSYHQAKFEDYKDKREKASNLSDWEKWDRKAADQLHKRNNGFWWLGSTLILSMMDAYVDAALFDYEAEEQKLKLQFDLNYLGLEFRF